MGISASSISGMVCFRRLWALWMIRLRLEPNPLVERAETAISTTRADLGTATISLVERAETALGTTLAASRNRKSPGTSRLGGGEKYAGALRGVGELRV